MIEKTFTKRLFTFLLTLALMVTPVSAEGGFWQDLGSVGGIWQDLGNLGEIWSDSGLGAVFGDTNLDTIPFSGLGASDLPAQWNLLENKVIARGSPDGTTIYRNIYGECNDPDGPEIISIVSAHGRFTPYMEGNDIKIRNLDPAHTGTHTIVLDCNNIQASFQLSIIEAPANQPPVANAGPDRTVDVNDVITFDGSASSDPDGTITSFVWNFGDGTTAAGRTATHAFTSLGTFTVTLTVTDNNGATASDTATVIANGRPTAVLVCPATGQVNAQLTFDARQSTDDTRITNYRFDFGDTTSISGTNALVQKVYGSAGTFAVTLTVTDDDNLTHQTSCSVTITASPANQPPTANAGPDRTVNINTQVTFDGSASSDPDGTITSFVWNFGDGTTAAGRTATHAFTSLGTFTVTLTVTDNNGATASDTAIIIADGRPTAVLECPAAARVSEDITFDAQKSTDNTRITSYKFEFGDSTSTTTGAATAKKKYERAGVFAVTLTVTDTDNLSHQASCVITVSQKAEERKRQRERLVFSNVNFDEEVSHPGDILEMRVFLSNDGVRDEDNMRLTLYSYDLDIRMTSGLFDLDQNGNVRKVFYLEIPEDTRPGEYDIQITASNDRQKHETFRTITIR